MKETKRINEAKELVKRLHGIQTRKSGLPYYTHLFAVAEIVSEYTDDEDVIIGALAHDTLEDVKGYSYEDLTRDCGERVARIVYGVTEEAFPGWRDLSREEKIKKFEEQLLRNVARMEEVGPDSLLVAAADKIHNIECLIEGVEKEGVEFLGKFKVPIEQKFRYFEKVLGAVKKSGHTEIALRFEEALNRARTYFSKLGNT